ncbi:CRP-like cAMP-binding protein [Rhizobium mongolense USDA 1844]|uniref:CRP-like cAMP-binding protein n=3 Tax=Rhizobium mongolense TaxID=57676 RepID=A0A559TKT7_9HYPH|nr:CRP-like cAMP-binding protein [Rhizobium mongolense USDA 1844]
MTKMTVMTEDTNNLEKGTAMLAVNPALLNSDLFRGLEEDALEAFMGIARLRTVAPLQQIVAEGDDARSMFCVIHGYVRLIKTDRAGHQADIYVCEPRDTFGEYLLSVGKTYAYCACATNHTAIAEFDFGSLAALLDRFPPVEKNITRAMARNFLAAVECIAADRLNTAVQRVANYLLDRGLHDTTSAVIRLPYPKQVLARKLGLAPGALSRAFASLSTFGIAVRGRYIHIADADLLRTAC